MIPTTATIVNALNYFCFEHIFNQTRINYNVNIKLTPVGSRFVVGYINDNNRTQLPDLTNQYAVFTTLHKNFNGGLQIDEDVWINSVDIINKNDILLHVFPITGKIVPKYAVYFYRSSISQVIYVAILKSPLLSITGIGSYKSLYVTVFRGSILDQEQTCHSLQIPATQDTGLPAILAVNNVIANCISTNKDGTSVFINGIEHNTDDVISVNYGDYVDVILDTGVIGSFNVNLTDIETGYYSTKDRCNKELIHIPKLLNPHNYLITHEECSLFVRSNITKQGAYLHRTELTSVTQVTHNDIAVATNVIDAFRTYLNTNDISIHVKIRTHKTPLIKDRNYIQFLYLENDATILKHLRGKVSTKLSFWTASVLEQSLYIQLMFSPPTFATASTLTKYIDGLGYYTAAAVLAKHLQQVTEKVDAINDLTVTKPVLYRGNYTYPLVSLDGIKLHNDSVDFIDRGCNTITVGFKNNTYIAPGRKVSVNLIADGEDRPYVHNVSSSNTNFTVPFSDVDVYQVLTIPTVVGRNVVSNTSYKKLSPKTGVLVVNESSSTTTVICGPSMYGETILIQNKNFKKHYSFDVSDVVRSNDTICITLTNSCENVGFIYTPLLSATCLNIYINGKILIEGIDYTALPILDSDDNIAINQVLISNKMYLDLTSTGSNIIEIIAHTSTDIADEVGYVVDNKIHVKNNINIWYYGLSEAYIGGCLNMDIADRDIGFYPVTGGNATPFIVRSNVPQVLFDVLSSYSKTDDDNRISAIDDYFNMNYSENDIVIVDQSYELYCPYLNAIIADVLAGKLAIYGDPDDTLFLAQFASYDYLKERDPTINLLTVGNRIDKRYVDVNVMYGNATVVGSTMYKHLHRLATLVLGTDKFSLGDVNDG